MVVSIHTRFLSDISDTGAYLTTNGIFRIAIPIFLLVSGFYFYQLKTNKEKLHWFKRIISLYMFWMIFYAYFWLNPTEVSVLECARIGQTLINGYYHLWYLPGLIGAAFLLQVLNQYQLNIFAPIICLFIAGVAIQYIGNYNLITNPAINTLFNSDWFHRNFLFLGFPFFGIGFLFNKHNVIQKASLPSIVAVTILGITLLTLESYTNYIQPTRFGGFDNFASLLIVCPAVFLLFMKITIYGKSKQFALYSSGIYFIHPFLISLDEKFFGFEDTLLTLIIFMSATLASYILIRINRKLKFIL